MKKKQKNKSSLTLYPLIALYLSIRNIGYEVVVSNGNPCDVLLNATVKSWVNVCLKYNNITYEECNKECNLKNITKQTCLNKTYTAEEINTLRRSK